MGADSFFVIGKSHDICEDYAIHGVHAETIPYTILCDGCSSSRDTDFGSRLLSKSIERNLMWLLELHEDIILTSNRYISEAKMYSDIMGLDIESLNATALIAYKNKTDYCVNVYGDGVVVAKTDSGYEVFVIDYPSGAPAYISYALTQDQFKNYSEMFGVTLTINKYFLDYKFNVVDQYFESYSITNPLNPYTIILDKMKCEFVAIFSDGIQTFTVTEIEGSSKIQNTISLFKILKMILSFKSMNGKFVKRRFKKFMKEANNNGWENFDDVSLGVVS